MKRWLLSLMAVASTGCLYDAPPAPGRPEPADPAVVGSWRCVSGDDEETTLMTVTPQADARYAVTLASRSEAPDHYEAYAVTRSGSRLVNVQEVGEKGSRKWNLARYSLPRRDALLVELARDDAFKGIDTDARRDAVIRDGLARKDLFDDFFVCARLKPKK